MLNILHLTIIKKWFDLIASGEKKKEYREVKKYWVDRLFFYLPESDSYEELPFDEVHFRNGYAKNAPFMRVEFKGLGMTEVFDGKECYVICLGDVIEVKNND